MSNKSRPKRQVVKNNDDLNICKRPYTLGRRLANSDSTRAAVLRAAKRRLEHNGYQDLTMECLASDTGVTRQTVHNLFGTKSLLIEDLFDETALEASMNRMWEIMRLPDPHSMLREFVMAICSFWSSQRLLIRRIHGIGAIDPDFGKAIESRNRRRQMAAARIIGILDAKEAKDKDKEKDSRTQVERIATLYALTSFEFFDALAEASPAADITENVLALIEKCVVA
jgi:AcrR family transcriptional regulator